MGLAGFGAHGLHSLGFRAYQVCSSGLAGFGCLQGSGVEL